jgi:CDP-diacylglycerol---serine O-phosphatidyltransferase
MTDQPPKQDAAPAKHDPSELRVGERRSLKNRSRRFRRGAAILPSLFTVGNLFAGFWAIIKTFQGHYAAAAPLIMWAILLDLLDGRIARMTGTTSEFGAELDSLSDVISFGVAPALLAFAWGFSTTPRIGWLVAFLFVTCGTLRLARFNVQRGASDGRFFVGLPIPAGAAQVAAWVNVFPAPLLDRPSVMACLVLMITFSFLMVSTFRYTSFKKVDLRSRRSSYIVVLGIATLFLLVALQPAWVLLGLASVYWLHGPIGYLVGGSKRREAEPVIDIETAAPNTSA